MSYTVGQIIRTCPRELTGPFTVYRVTGFVLDLIEAAPVNGGESKFLHPDAVVLFTVENGFGSISIGDRVRCMGLEGVHNLLGFYKARSTGELMAIISYNDSSIPWTIEYVRKAKE